MRKNKIATTIGTTALGIALAGCFALGGMAATTDSLLTQQEQLHTLREQVQSKFDELNASDLTEEQEVAFAAAQEQLKSSFDGQGRGANLNDVLTKEQIEAMTDMTQEERQAYLETNLTDEQKEAMQNKRGEPGGMLNSNVTDEQIAAMKNMTQEERKAYLEANLTDEQKAALEAQKPAEGMKHERADLTDEQKAALESKMKERIEAMSDEEKSKMETSLQEQIKTYEEILTSLKAIA